MYHANAGFLPVQDVAPNVLLPNTFLREGSLSFSPREDPFLFSWRRTDEPGVLKISRWDQTGGSRTALEAYEAGRLVPEPPYSLAAGGTAGRYVPIYGPGAGLCGLPVAAALRLFGGDLRGRPAALWYGAKFTASALVATSVVLVFLIASIHVRRGVAVTIAASYACGTCAWSVSSQALWQHVPTLVLLPLGAYLYLRGGERRRDALLSGLAFGAAIFCRPTGLIAGLAVGTYLALRGRSRLGPYAAGFLAAVALGGIYNAVQFGSPLRFGQSEVASKVAEIKTLDPDPWQTPLWEGAAGVLFSPARGLLVFSPFLAFAFWGLAVAARERAWEPLRPLVVGVLGVFLVTFKWFDWWGGWSFGYRIVMEIVPLLALLLIPVATRIAESRWLRAAAAVLLAWSVGVQILGAFAYNLRGWDAAADAYELRLPGRAAPARVKDPEEALRLLKDSGATLVRVIRRNVDRPEHRHRLWSVADSPLVYYATRFAEARRARRAALDEFLAEGSGH